MITQSEKIDELIPALIKARLAMKPAKKTQTNPFFKSNYAGLTDILECSLPLLMENGMFISQQPVIEEDRSLLKTQVSHVSGQWMCSYTPIVNGKPNDPQAQGSAITYARRHGYESMFSMDKEDDDGNGAMPAARTTTTPTTTSTKPAESKPSGDVPLVTEGQVKLLGVKFKEFTDDQRHAWLLKNYGVESRKDLPRTAVNEIMKIHEGGMLSPLDLDDDIPF